MNKKILNSFVFILVYVDDNLMDMAGNKYSCEGYIKAQKFTKDIDIKYGLYGILWGKTDYLIYEKIKKNNNWTVVKSHSSGLIKVSRVTNRVKFKSGLILYLGNVINAAKYIINNIKKSKHFLRKDSLNIKPNEIVGSKMWLKKYNSENRSKARIR